jgi:hypothetical protein
MPRWQMHPSRGKGTVLLHLQALHLLPQVVKGRVWEGCTRMQASTASGTSSVRSRTGLIWVVRRQQGECNGCQTQTAASGPLHPLLPLPRSFSLPRET